MFETIISPENIFCAWREFQKDKRNRADVQAFEVDAEEAIFGLCEELKAGTYRHGPYEPFWVRDPKLRLIHKACVRDRLLHHAVFRVLYPIFDKSWIHDSFSSREWKGTHAAVKRFRDFAWKISRNNTRDVWVLKLDVRKYFDSIDHDILLHLLADVLTDGPGTSDKTLLSEKDDRLVKNDGRLIDLLQDNIQSYYTSREYNPALSCKGIPLGNLTSQLFANVYLNPLDQYVKRRLGVPYYIRYADDIIIVSGSQEFLADLLPKISSFLEDEFQLTAHPNKVSISRWDKGIDVLGFISYPHKTVMRPSTERRMTERLEEEYELAILSGNLSDNVSESDFNVQLNAMYSRMKFERGR